MLCTSNDRALIEKMAHFSFTHKKVNNTDSLQAFGCKGTTRSTKFIKIYLVKEQQCKKIWKKIHERSEKHQKI